MFLSKQTFFTCITPGGGLSQIRTNPVAKASEEISQADHISSEESFIYINPGQILAGKKGIRVFSSNGYQDIRLLHAYAPISFERTIFTNEDKIKDTKFIDLFSNPEDKLYGVIYKVDDNQHAIRKVSSESEVTTLIGNGAHVGGELRSARFSNPDPIFLGPCHQLFVFDDNGIRRIQLPPGPSAERP